MMLNGIEDSIVTHSDAKDVFAILELLSSRWKWIFGEGQDMRIDTPKDLAGKLT